MSRNIKDRREQGKRKLITELEKEDAERFKVVNITSQKKSQFRQTKIHKDTVKDVERDLK